MFSNPHTGYNNAMQGNNNQGYGNNKGMPMQQQQQQYPQQGAAGISPQQLQVIQYMIQEAIRAALPSTQQSQPMQQSMPFNNGMPDTTTDNRFVSTRVEEKVEPVKESVQVPRVENPLLHSTDEIRVKVPNWNSLFLKVIQTNVNRDSVYMPVNMPMVTSLSEAVDLVSEDNYQDIDGESVIQRVTLKRIIILNVTNGVNKQTTVDNLFSEDIYFLHNKLEALQNASVTKYEYALYKSIDKQITKAINSYIRINTPTSLSIESFVIDFVDLTNRISNLNTEVKIGFEEYMKRYVKDYNVCLVAIRVAENFEHIYDNKTFTCREECFIYVDNVSCELGLHNLEIGVSTQIMSGNTFLLSLNDAALPEEPVFNLVTIEKDVYRVVNSTDGKVYITKLQ